MIESQTTQGESQEREFMPLADFIASAGITMACEESDDNPNMDSDSRDRMDHWKCLLRSGRSRLTIYFSMGIGHHGNQPELAEVLDCLSSDASGIENARSFEDWCADYGYNADSRKAERTFRTCERQANKLKKFLGDSAYETLLWRTERL